MKGKYLVYVGPRPVGAIIETTLSWLFEPSGTSVPSFAGTSLRETMDYCSENLLCCTFTKAEKGE